MTGIYLYWWHAHSPHIALCIWKAHYCMYIISKFKICVRITQNNIGLVSSSLYMYFILYFDATKLKICELQKLLKHENKVTAIETVYTVFILCACWAVICCFIIPALPGLWRLGICDQTMSAIFKWHTTKTFTGCKYLSFFFVIWNNN